MNVANIWHLWFEALASEQKTLYNPEECKVKDSSIGIFQSWS